MFGMVNPMSLTAAQAAYAHGGAWHEALKQYLDENFAFVKAFLARELPEAVMYIPEATYLAWVDLSRCLPDVADLPDFQRLDVFIHRQRVLLFGKPQIGIPVARNERYRIRPVEIVLSAEMVEMQDVGLEIVARQHQVPGDAPVFGHLDAAHGLNRKG